MNVILRYTEYKTGKFIIENPGEMSQKGGYNTGSVSNL
jgi:hypothetical protein